MVVILRTVQEIWKELDESSGDYEATAAGKLQSDHSYEKIPLKFVREIQAMIYYDPGKSIWSIASDMGISYPVGSTIFITNHEGWEERPYCKAFEQAQTSPPTKHALNILRWEKFLLVSDCELTEQALAFSVPKRCTAIDKNRTPSLHHGV